MKAERKLTITLTIDDIKDIILEHLRSKGYKAEAGSVEFDIGPIFNGVDTTVFSVQQFKGCTVIIPETIQKMELRNK